MKNLHVHNTSLDPKEPTVISEAEPLTWPTVLGYGVAFLTVCWFGGHIMVYLAIKWMV